MSINRIAAHLAVAWHTANEAILAYGEELLLADSTRFEGVRVIGVMSTCGVIGVGTGTPR